MIPNREVCLRAVASRDARFDGEFFTAVRTTRIYCRPSCPALTPRPENTSFYASAAAAQDAGYRACRRCRPDTVPGSAAWDVRADTVARAMRLIGDGLVDREGVPGVAGRLGYSVRQLQRVLAGELGASPLALARAQRAHTARVLLETTDLKLGEVAFAAGFGSVRSFNDAIRAAFALTPGELRARLRRDRRPRRLGAVELRLPVRRPFEASNLFGHLAATAVPGVEEWRDGAYRRTLTLPHGPGIAALAPRADHVTATLWLADPRDLTPAIGRCRRLLDLDADPVAVDEVLAADPALAPLVAAAPGRRVPRGVDGAETALRMVLGQQVSTAAARTQTARVVRRLGTPVDDPGGGLTHLFPGPDAVATLAPADLAGPRRRAETLIGLASALAGGSIDLSAGADRSEARRALAALPGIGPWTVENVAMRALGDPDAFPATDLGVVRAAQRLGIGGLATASERWRPWRSYATQYLWSVLDHPINRVPEAS
ncbi:DNA-3-methyladenine glycosylase 2 [Micropruina sonneratiae]|uniref:DNA-3-methyladenine glycosylase 2 n=1 Tax=Micropruina sonneratiae TaxID=2986940 RepID=UPI0022261D76|nr:DNA-3-methyladenine glycosylase 2 [Micropruina sp. KQZ13P-5]MCW3159089.1 helix-turn-helix domain-containing protein [Micropruina sp. KQZ13P-5]